MCRYRRFFFRAIADVQGASCKLSNFAGRSCCLSIALTLDTNEGNSTVPRFSTVCTIVQDSARGRLKRRALWAVVPQRGRGGGGGGCATAVP